MGLSGGMNATKGRGNAQMGEMGTYLSEPSGELFIGNVILVIERRKESNGAQTRTPIFPVVLLVQEMLDLNRAIRDANDINRSLGVKHFLRHIIKNVVDVLLSVTVSRDCVIPFVESKLSMDGGLLRQRKPGALRDCFLASAPPSELAHVGDDDSG